VYTPDVLQAMAEVVKRKEQEYNSPIAVISDEPYNKLVYDNLVPPPLMKYFPNCVLVNSFSKSLALPGERIGYIAVSPQIEDVPALISAMIFANRTLGFVNAPSLFQKLVVSCLDETPDITEYQQRRDFFHQQLTALGFDCIKPQGAFYLFPKSLIPDDIEFVRRALRYNLLLVPGAGFFCPGYFRIAYCVNMDTIKNSMGAFAKLAAEFK
jgi:aspartate aminotransferase